MFTKTTLLIIAVLCGSLAIQAQQNPQPAQPAQPTITQTLPCAPTTQQAPSEVSKHVHFHLPTALQKAIDKQRAEIEKKTGIQLAPITPDDITKQVQKPCKPAPAASAAAANTSQPQPPASAGAPFNTGKQTTAQGGAPAPSNGAPTVSPKQSDFYADELACLLKRQRDNDHSDPSTCIPSPPTTTTTPKQ
jgi:hypothetical protein